MDSNISNKSLKIKTEPQKPFTVPKRNVDWMGGLLLVEIGERNTPLETEGLAGLVM